MKIVPTIALCLVIIGGRSALDYFIKVGPIVLLLKVRAGRKPHDLHGDGVPRVEWLEPVHQNTLLKYVKFMTSCFHSP
jgi:hypothetical protein